MYGTQYKVKDTVLAIPAIVGISTAETRSVHVRLENASPFVNEENLAGTVGALIDILWSIPTVGISDLRVVVNRIVE